MCERTRWAAVLAGALAVLAPGAARAADSTPVIAEGFESYFLANVQDARPKLAACGWRAGDIRILAHRVEYDFHPVDGDGSAVVALSHHAACAEAVGPFCIDLLHAPSSAAGECDPKRLLPGVLSRGIRHNQLPFSWVRASGSSERTQSAWPWAPLGFVVIALALSVWAVRRRIDFAPRVVARVVASWRTLLNPAVLASFGAACITVVAAPAFFGVLLAAWLGWQLLSLATAAVDRLLVGKLLLLSLLAAAAGAALYPSEQFAMYSRDGFEIVGPLATARYAAVLSRLTGPVSDFLLATAGSSTTGRLATPLLAAATLTLLAVGLLRRGGARRSLWAAVLLVAVSPAFLRLGVEAPFPFVVILAAATAARDWQRHADGGGSAALVRSALGAALASYLLSGLLLLPLLAVPFWAAWRERRAQDASRLSRALWPIILATQIGVVVALHTWAGPTSEHALRHASAVGILWRYQLVHPVFAALALLGLAHAVRTWPLVTATAVVLAGGALVGEAAWGVDSLVAATVALPASWLLTAVGVTALDTHLHLQGARRALLFVALALLVLHHQWLFHDVFGRLLFS